MAYDLVERQVIALDAILNRSYDHLFATRLYVMPAHPCVLPVKDPVRKNGVQKDSRPTIFWERSKRIFVCSCGARWHVTLGALSCPWWERIYP